MRIEIRAVGRIKAGPERALIDDYLARARTAGRGLGVTAVKERELDPRTLKTKAAETDALAADLPAGALVFVLDETGKSQKSKDFAAALDRARADGVRDVACLIGGADGHERSRLPAGARCIAYGAATWPHKLVRVMLAEQIYRAVSLLAGSPYHREG